MKSLVEEKNLVPTHQLEQTFLLLTQFLEWVILLTQ